MNSILEKIESVDSFDELANLLQSKDLIKEVHDFLHRLNNPSQAHATTHSHKKQKITKKLNIMDSRIFLTAYMIHKFPKDTLGTIGETTNEGLEITCNEQDNALLTKANELISFVKININDNFDRNYILQFLTIFNDFKNLFNMWKIKDRDELKNSLIKEYHQLTVNIMNEKETLFEHSGSLSEKELEHNELTLDRISVLEQCKASLIESALILGGKDLVDEVNQYSPVVIDLEQLCKTYGNAFWDVLEIEYKEKKYDKIFIILENILKLFTILYDPDENDLQEQTKNNRIEKITEIKEKLDIDFIQQQLTHNVYSNAEMYSLCTFIINIMKQIVASQFDENLSVLEQNISNPDFLPIFLREISTLLQITVSDTLQFRKAVENSE
jgi:hypothetical protein